MFKKRLLLYLLISIFSVSCAPYQMKAIMAYRDNNYESALKYSLIHVQNNPNDTEILDLLNTSAKKYFENTKRQIEHYKKIEDWQNLIRVSNASYSLLSQVIQVVGVEYPTKTDLEFLAEIKDESKVKTAEEIYSEGKTLYESGDYSLALEKFNQVNSYVNHYKDTENMIRLSSEQLANIEYQDGTRLMMNNDLEGAVVKFENALNYSPNFRDSNELIYSIQGQLADKYFFESGRLFQASDYMNAYEAIQRALDYRDDYPGAREQLTLIEDKLTKRIAVFPFEAKDLNQSYGDMAAQQLISDLLARNDKFIKVLERQNLEKIFEEQALSQTGAIDEATAVEVGKLTGVNTIVMGTVSLIGVKDYPVSKDTKVGYYNRAYRDVRNVKRERKEKFNYSVYERKRSVEVNINYRMISVETGEILESHSINSEQTDVVNWVDAPKSRLNDLPSSVKSLSTSAQSLKPKDTLVNGALFDASTKVSNFIFTKLNKGGI